MNVEYGIPCARQYARALTPLRRHHQTRANHALAPNRCRSIRRSASPRCGQNPSGKGDGLDVLGRTDTLARYSQIDYWRDMALVVEAPAAAASMAGTPDNPLPHRFAGVARYMLNPDMRSCEFAIVIDDQWQGKGLGAILMQSLIDVARSRRLQHMEGSVISLNRKMLKLMHRLGFTSRLDPDDASMTLVELAL